MASDGEAVRLVFDASGILGFDHSEVRMVGDILSYFEKSDHKLIMCSENLYECHLALRSALKKSSVTSEVKVSEDVFKQVKAICHLTAPVGPNDYKCIATAIEQKADFLVSNDYGLIKAANVCRNQGQGKFRVLTPVSLLFYMYRKHRELFDWKPSLIGAVKFYHEVEVPRVFHGVTKLNFTERDTRQVFTPYATHIYDTLKTVNPV
jgi:predicted nucleic acid-binding protein